MSTSTIPGGITVPSDARPDVYGDLPLRDMVARVISALTFEGTHELASDQRLVPAGTASEVDKLRDEQRQRINTRYGSLMQPTPDHVQRDLLFLYRGEASSVDLAKESQGRERSVIDLTTDESVRILKKEMKQKIHEWEGSFRQANGKEAGPHDKAALRPVYEVCKVAKNRITPPADAPPPAVRPSSAAHQPTQPSGASSGARPSSGASAAAPAPSSAAPSSQQTSSNAGAGSGGSGVGGSGANAAAGGGGATSSSAGGSAAGGGASGSGSTTLPLARRLSLDEAAQEKRKLKRKLHQFESDFERRNGRPPQRDDRREYSGDYARYAELKAMLSER